MGLKNKIFCFDLDNTICSTFKSDYINSKPKRKIIKFINKLFYKNYTIKIYTARYMGRNNDNIKKIKRKDKIATIRQLKSWGLKYHKLFFGKPSFDILIDDKSYDFQKNWIKKINNFLNI
jgi:hypothetical protein